LAKIYVDDDNDALVVLDEDLWFEDKEPKDAQAVAAILGAELEANANCMTLPFA
jgi:hypothetical protein